jgi:hypothetical protein
MNLTLLLYSSACTSNELHKWLGLESELISFFLLLSFSSQEARFTLLAFKSFEAYLDIANAARILGSCMVTLTNSNCILVYMRRLMRKMILGSNTTVSVLVLYEMDCYSMQLLWYGPSSFFFYSPGV